MCRGIEKEGLLLDFVLYDKCYFVTADVTFMPEEEERKCAACIETAALAQGVHSYPKFHVSQLKPVELRRVGEKDPIPLDSDEGLVVMEHARTKLTPDDHAERPYFCKGCFTSLWLILDERRKLQRLPRKERMGCSLNEPLL
jgi:hypothetical protein